MPNSLKSMFLGNFIHPNRVNTPRCLKRWPILAKGQGFFSKGKQQFWGIFSKRNLRSLDTKCCWQSGGRSYLPFKDFCDFLALIFLWRKNVDKPFVVGILLVYFHYQHIFIVYIIYIYIYLVSSLEGCLHFLQKNTNISDIRWTNGVSPWPTFPPTPKVDSLMKSGQDDARR